MKYVLQNNGEATVIKSMNRPFIIGFPKVNDAVQNATRLVSQNALVERGNPRIVRARGGQSRKTMVVEKNAKLTVPLRSPFNNMYRVECIDDTDFFNILREENTGVIIPFRVIDKNSFKIVFECHLMETIFPEK